MEKKCSPLNITALQKNEVFVFGSNESGKHGRGAARTALKWGAIWGAAAGLQGQTYAIPTKDFRIIKTLPLEEIRVYVEQFINFASVHPDLTFLVTEIGCGLAGLKPEQVAPLFKGAMNIQNILLPKRFLELLNKEKNVKECDATESDSSKKVGDKK